MFGGTDTTLSLSVFLPAVLSDLKEMGIDDHRGLNPHGLPNHLVGVVEMSAIDRVSENQLDGSQRPMGVSTPCHHPIRGQSGLDFLDRHRMAVPVIDFLNPLALKGVDLQHSIA